MKWLKDSFLRGILVFCLGLTMLLAPIDVFATTNNDLVQNQDASMTVSRFGGVDQYETAMKIAEGGWSSTSNAIVLCSGRRPNLIDAIAAGPLAAVLNAPIILTDDGTQLNEFAVKEITRLQPKQAYITSGHAVIKQQVLDELQSMGVTPVELGGFDQYETSVNIAREMQTLGATVTKLAVVAGWVSPADALSIGSIAASEKMPILATTKNELPIKVKEYLDRVKNLVTDSYVIGGPAVVSDTVMNSLPGTEQRCFGNSKYDTNLDVLKKFASNIKYDKVYIANGETLVDALAGVPLAAKDSAPILLMDKTLDPSIAAYAKLNLPTHVIALGGEAVVTQDALDQFSSIVPADNVLGNTPGNINNQGIAAVQGDYVYYFQSVGTTPKSGAIYKMKKDGTGKIKLCDVGIDDAFSPDINVVGDWVYYRYSTPVNYTYRDSEGSVVNATAYAGSIYKIRTDGTENTKLCSDNARNITVIGDWIYYDSAKLSMYDYSTQPGLFKIKTDGSGLVKLAEFQEMGYIANITDGFIYYYDNTNGIYRRMALDGSGKTPIIDSSFMTFASKDWIYSIGGDFWTDAQIYKAKIDGTQKTLLYSGPALGNRLNVSGDSIYFGTWPNKGTFKVKTDGTGLTKISEDSARNICVAGDYIYYRFYDSPNYVEGDTYRMKLDGTDRTNLAQ